jgi:two-component system, NtrC family, response regulator AtoC
MLHALIYSEDTDAIVALSDVFRETGFAVRAVRDARQARAALSREPPDVALVDYDILGAAGIAFLESSRLGSLVPLLLTSADPKLSAALQGMDLGISEVLARPVDPAQLRAALERVRAGIEHPDAGQAADATPLAGLGEMLGASAGMRRLSELLQKVAPTSMTVLLCGESGVGKELAARAIHQLGGRPDGPMVAVNCGAITPELMESELFGHEKGSFTGANQRHIGFFERATGGTLFLDEITEMAPALQVKLLRVLETRQLRRVGGQADIEVDVRVVAATNRDPDEAVEQGALREDLYYRLAQFPVRIPPLRERGDDIALLAGRFLDELNTANGAVKSFAPATLEALRVHDWPGNVRELRNAISRAWVLANETIQPDDLPSRVVNGGTGDADTLRIAIGLSLAEVERRAILATVGHFEGDRKAAAQALGITTRTLRNKLKGYQSR